MGKPIQKASDTLINNAVEWANSRFKIIDVEDLYTYKNLLKEAQQIKACLELRWFINRPL